MTLKTDNDPIDAMLAALDAPAADRDYRPGHARVRALLDVLALHRPRLRVRVAGTNGKGSTATMLAAGLRAAGLRVGLYTSPHILRFAERIRVDGQPAPDGALRRGLERLLPRAREVGASWFEVATALALGHFSDAEVDAEVLEAGVGARLDATTAVPADMALITPIALDHQAWLGDTLAAIAAEKAHAMDGCRFALSAPQPRQAREALRAHRADVTFVDDPWPGALAMPGAHQRVNAALAMAALLALRDAALLDADEQTLARAVEETRAPGRLQCVRWRSWRIWLDAAHNAHAVEALRPSLPALAAKPDGVLDAIFVFTREDRDLADALPRLRPYARRIVAGLPASGSDCDASYENLAEALEAELAPGESEREDKACLVLGSFTTVAAALRWLAARGALNPRP